MFKRRVALLGLLASFVITALLFALLTEQPISIDEQSRLLRRQFARGEYADVVSAARKLRGELQLSNDIAILAGESATKQGQFREAELFYASVLKPAKEYAVAQLALGEILREQGNLSLAESSFENVLDPEPDNHIALSRLALLKMSTGRVSEATPNLKKLLQLRLITWMELGWLAVPDRGVNANDFLQKCRRNFPDDPVPAIGIAHNLFNRGAYHDAIELLRQIDVSGTLLDHRDLLMLQCYLQSGESFDLPADAAQRFQAFRKNANRDGLFTLGAILESNGLEAGAIFCFAECLRVSDHLSASQHLLVLLSGTRPQINVQPLRNRIQLLSRLDTVVRALSPEVQNPEAAKEISEIMSHLGRSDEAIAWSAVAEKSGLIATGHLTLDADISEILALCLASSADLSFTETPKNHPQTSLEANGKKLPDSVSMIDDAAAVGINFTYFESPDESTIGRRMFEWTGGGVGVLDLDHDTWPDLLFSQGTDWPVNRDSSKWLDAVYRNLNGQSFVQVTSVSGLKESGYSQGVSVGDLNNDGFSDLVVANIGDNSYWMNQGDGTFTEFNAVPGAEANSAVWTSSVAIADVNSDGLPDIFEVRYVSGEELSTLICPTAVSPRACSPLAFKPTLDRLLMNNGDGTFKDASIDAGINYPGNGLGLIITNLDSDPLPEIFVANDAMPNALWDNQAAAGELPRFVDQAVLRGVALSSEGLAQACMGIAADDFNGDGSTDLYVTNFYNEPNALYLFDSTGFAKDDALLSGIRRASMPMLGFGAQSLDSNDDSKPDIFLVNGDIDDFSHEGREFRMVPQLMVNEGQGRFHAEPSSNSSDIRNIPFRGRGVARLDWNNDHRWDVAISCLDDPARLITLQSNLVRPSTVVTFIGTASSRDAAGLQARDQGGRLQSLHAGSGYMASNQNMMIWPLPSVITVEFASAAATAYTLKETPAQVIIEGRNEPVAIPQ